MILTKYPQFFFHPFRVGAKKKAFSVGAKQKK
jgi:hypothetical protein